MRNVALTILLAFFLAGCSGDQKERIEACATAISSFDLTQSPEKCDKLPLADQKKAAEIASKKSGVIVFLPPYEAKKAIEEAVAKGEPAFQPTTFNEVRELAMKGNYQAQRNLSFGYSSRPYAGQDTNPILACAWRIVIIRSGSEKVDETDISNHKVYCEKLERTARTAAEAQAEGLLKKIM